MKGSSWNIVIKKFSSNPLYEECVPSIPSFQHQNALHLHFVALNERFCHGFTGGLNLHLSGPRQILQLLHCATSINPCWGEVCLEHDSIWFKSEQVQRATIKLVQAIRRPLWRCAGLELSVQLAISKGAPCPTCRSPCPLLPSPTRFPALKPLVRLGYSPWVWSSAFQPLPLSYQTITGGFVHLRRW